MTGARSHDSFSVDGHEPFVQTPHWVLFDPVLSATAKTLYAALMAHVGPGDETVWPGRDTLAVVLGLRRPQSVDPYVRELRARGVISVERRKLGGMRVRNHYRVRWHPPDEHDGPRSLREFRRRLGGEE